MSLLGFGLAACSEDLDRLDEPRVSATAASQQARAPLHRSDDWDEQLRERTQQHQNEAERIYR